MIQFSEGGVVVLTADDPALELTAGAAGVIWGLYATTPPSYEVTFEGKDGRKFDVTMSEDELMTASSLRELAGSERP